MPLPILKIGLIKKSTVVVYNPERSLLALIGYELDNGQTVYERTPKSFQREIGQKIGHYQTHFIDGRPISNIIKL